ncbi:MAG: pentapeptide repeat-containing protein, partial [Cyanobacteria bacterium P01_D01_bin.36]
MPQKTNPSPEEKRHKRIDGIAHAIYQNRLNTGRKGDADSDWQIAESIVENPIRWWLFISNRPLRWFLFSLPKMEWVKLLAVPLVLAASGSIITSQFQREANQNAALKDYLDQLDTLTSERNLLAEQPDPGAIVLARGRTVAALRELDIPRKQQLISFLVASGLSRACEEGSCEEETRPVLNFDQQNLSKMDFRKINLSQIDLQGATLYDANLRRAFLYA